MAHGIICQSCGIEAPTKQIEFHQNIGALVIRFHSSVSGKLCKRCVHKHFWKMTGVNMTVGWWGLISVILTPIFMINNVARYLAALGMPPVPSGARPPTLSEQEIDRLIPFAEEIQDRINADEPVVVVMQDVAHRAKVTPGQVVLFVIQLGNYIANQPPELPTHAFPVQPIPVEPPPLPQ